MRIEDGRFTRHIMITHKRPLRHLHDVDSMWAVGGFATIRIQNEKCKFWPIWNKENKNHPPIGDKDEAYI